VKRKHKTIYKVDIDTKGVYVPNV